MEVGLWASKYEGDQSVDDLQMITVLSIHIYVLFQDSKTPSRCLDQLY